MKHLIEKLNKLSLDTFPRTLMLSGEKGCGKTSLIKLIANKLSLESENITENISLELIDSIVQRPVPKIYVIHTEQLSVREENVILKFLEEPLKNSYLILTTENKHSVLPTVQNRCVVWDFLPYSDEELTEFVTKPAKNLLLVARTPGKILEYQDHPIDDMVVLANKIFDFIHTANIANALSLSGKLAFKHEQDKFDVDIFFDILNVVSADRYLKSALNAFEYWRLSNALLKDSKIFNVDKKALFDNYIINLRLSSAQKK